MLILIKLYIFLVPVYSVNRVYWYV